ncbi:hypothetical protein TNCV_2009131 [Trichonephila clavipes]|nr:hypothetical protein TNCV_2009131 [Trichonephila clavipes]
MGCCTTGFSLDYSLEIDKNTKRTVPALAYGENVVNDDGMCNDLYGRLDHQIPYLWRNLMDKSQVIGVSRRSDLPNEPNNRCLHLGG